jgi:hypothetical protein
MFILIEPKMIIHFLNNEINIYVVIKTTWKNLV